MLEFIRWSLESRLFVLFLVAICANYWIMDHDADAFRLAFIFIISGLKFFTFITIFRWRLKSPASRASKARPPKTSTEIVDNVEWALETAFDGVAKWDGAHFMHIAEYGYTFENNLAFGPLYPELVKRSG